jgi:mortality factor 4-like protein 1
MGDGASPAYAVGDAVLATHDDGKTYSAKVIDTRTKDGVAEFKVHWSGFNKKQDQWLAVAKMVRDTVDARREAGMTDKPGDEPEGAPEPTKDARAKKPKAKPAAKANASERSDAKASAESGAPAAETSKKKRSEAEPAAAGSAKRAKTLDAEREPEPKRPSAKEKAPKREPEEGAAKVPGKKVPGKKKKPTAANGEDANAPAAEPSEQEETPSLRLELSASLKRELITGWERITREGKLLSLPRSVTAAEVLRRFEEDAKAKARSAEQAALASECAAGLKAYFDGALRASLLYAEERAQAEAVLAGGERFDAGGGEGKKMEPSAVYGAEHLLRLFVKLPELLPLRDMDAAAAKAVQAKLAEVLRWMQRNAAAHFGGEYVDAPVSAAAGMPEAAAAEAA